MKSLDHQILQNLLTELNIAKAKRSILLNSGLVPSILTKRIEYLEHEIVEQRKKIKKEEK